MASRKTKRRHFTPEYKAEVVALVVKGGKTPAQTARDLDLTETSVRAWVRQAEIDQGKGPAGALTTAEPRVTSSSTASSTTRRLSM